MSSAAVPNNNSSNHFMVVTQGVSQAATRQNGAGTGPRFPNIRVTSQRYQRTEPKALGILQILAGFAHLFCGIVMSFATTPVSFYIGIYFWGALTYIITGSLTIAEKRSKPKLIYSSVGMNILSVVTAGIIVTVLAVDIAEGLGFGPCSSFWITNKCRKFKQWAEPIRVALLITSAFHLLISFLTSVVGCKAICFTESVVTAVIVTPCQATCSTVVNPFQTHSGQQDVFYITNTDTTLNSPSTEDPPAYSDVFYITNTNTSLNNPSTEDPPAYSVCVE